MRLSKVKLLATALFCLVAVVCLPLNGQAYYGGLYGGYDMYGGLYGGYGLYGGMYGGGLYGSSLYGGYGMYGSSLYGGLYGGYGMYGGGLYGSLYGGLYGGYGMYGSSLYGGLYGLRYPYEAGSTPLLEPTRTPAALTSLTTTLLSGGGGGLSPAGTWSGTWLSYISLKGGICNMNLLYNSLTRTVTGTAGLLLNKLIPLPINVSGLYLGSPFTLSGSYFDLTSLVTYYEDLTCTLVTASYMTGTYLIHDALYLKSDTGNFNVNLALVPVI